MEKEIEFTKNIYDIFSLLIIENYEKIQIFKDLVTNVEDFSISPYYFFFKGLHYEYGIKKPKNQMYSLEFYKQGANLNNFLCFYKLYLIYSDNNSNSNLYIIGDNKFYQSQFYLLKFFSYYDDECLITYFTQFYNLETNHFNNLKNSFIMHRKELIMYLNKHQYDLNLDDREKEFLLINLVYLCDMNMSEYFSKLYELYKTNYHEETQYKIFCYLINMNQIDSLENFLSNKISLDGNLKVFSFLIKTFLNNLQKTKKDSNYVNQIINLISTDKKFWGRKLKFGCYFDIYADLKFYEIEVEQLYDAIIEDHFNSANSSENFNNGNQSNINPNSTSKIVKKIDKLILYYFKSLKFGNLNNIPKIFFLNLFANKNYLPYSQEEKIKIFTGIFEILDNIFVPFKTTINSDTVNKRVYLSNEMILILALYYIKGIKIKKNCTIGLGILNYLMGDRLQTLTIDEQISINFYLNKCKNKLRINDTQNLKFCSNKLNLVYSEIRIKNSLETKYSIQSLFYLIKTGLSEASKKESKNSMTEALLIIMYLGNFYSNSNMNLNRTKISFTVIDKIYLCKILKLMKTRKEFSSRESYLNKLSKIPSFDNMSIVSNPSDNCMSCMRNKKEALAVPCGHKLLCLSCYYKIKDDIFDLEYTCSKCSTKVESVIEKVYK